jgi:hypothetical protein
LSCPKNNGIRRRQTQTFSSADLAKENRLALRAGDVIRAWQSARELRMIPHREAAPQVAELKTHAAECASIQRPSAQVCVCLRQKNWYLNRGKMPLPQMG